METFVVDASATLPWCFEDEATPWTEGLLIVFAVETELRSRRIGRLKSPTDC